MFSPILAIIAFNFSSTVCPASAAHGSAKKASTFAADVTLACAATSLTYCWKTSFFATKSVSEFTSTIDALLPSSDTSTATIPSAAIRPDFLAAFAKPFSRSHSTAASISPSVFVSAFLQSIMPAPVISLNSFTCEAVIAISLVLHFPVKDYSASSAASVSSIETP